VTKSTNAVRVLVTRPKHQQDSFLARCSDAGLDTLSLPCIDILPVDCSIDAAEIDAAEFVFFTSRNAVEFAHAIQPLPWNKASVYCIGRATQRALAQFNQDLAHPPIEPFTSEALIEWLKTQPTIKSALIVKGVGGRNLIESFFEQSGATVNIKDVYKRVTPVVSDAERHRIFVDTPPNIISVTSDDVLRNLVNIAGPTYANELHATPIIVNSERCADLAVRLGFDHSPIIANPPGDDGQIDGIVCWLEKQKHT
jgi:uroporphyrinogen-III synthase